MLFRNPIGVISKNFSFSVDSRYERAEFKLLLLLSSSAYHTWIIKFFSELRKRIGYATRI